MHCYHCGKQIKDDKANALRPSFIDASNASSSEEIKLVTICPRCGHEIPATCTEENKKSLAQASHSMVQRANNSFAKGMGSVCIGIILLAIGIIFFLLARKAANGYKLSTTCPEFYVSLVAAVLAVILLSLGVVGVVYGIKTKRHYTLLLKELNNNVFHQ